MRILVSMLLLLSLMVSAIPVAYAASLTSLSLTLSSSVPDDTGVTHTFDFTKGTSGTIKGIRYEYCTSGSGTCTAPTGLDASSAAIDASGTDDEFDAWTVSATTGKIDISHATGDSSNASPIIAFSGVTNPSEVSGPTVFYVRVTTYSDAALTTAVDGPSQVASAVIPAVTVSGTQDAILELTVAGVSSGTAVGDAGDTKDTTGTATATTLPFGTFAPLTTGGAESKAVAHTVNVKTNGATGYTASVKGDSVAMTRSGGGTIDYVSASTDWVEASTTGFGVNAQGGDAVTGTFGTSGSYTYHPTATALTLATDGAPTAGANTTVVYRVQVAVTQAAGDYSGTVNYTVLPNF